MLPWTSSLPLPKIPGALAAAQEQPRSRAHLALTASYPVSGRQRTMPVRPGTSPHAHIQTILSIPGRTLLLEGGDSVNGVLTWDRLRGGPCRAAALRRQP